MHIEFCAKLNVLEGKYAIMQNIEFLLSWVGNPCRYLVLRPCKKGPDFVEALLARAAAQGGPPQNPFVFYKAVRRDTGMGYRSMITKIQCFA